MKKENKKTNAYWLYGRHTVISVLNNQDRKYIQLFVTKESLNFLKENNIQINELKVTPKIVSNADLISITGFQNAVHQGIALQVMPSIQLDINELMDKLHNKFQSVIVILDHITDPNNIGSIIRSAVAFAADAVITPYDKAPGETSGILKSASGSFEFIPYIQVTNLVQTIKMLKANNYWVVGLSAHAEQNLQSSNIDFAKIAIVLGSESNGMRRLTAENCDFLVKLPIADNVESLNVSNAAAIMLYEIFKKNMK